MIAGDDRRAKTEALRGLWVEITLIGAAFAITERYLGRTLIFQELIEIVRFLRPFLAARRGWARWIYHQHIPCHDEDDIARSIAVFPERGHRPTLRVVRPPP